MKRLGGKKRRCGFTLIEAMMATAILAVGALSIFEALFISLDAYNYCRRYLEIAPRANEILWKAQNDLASFGALESVGPSGGFDAENRKIAWNMVVTEIAGGARLYRVDLLCLWKEGRKDVTLSRSAYALYRETD